MINPCQNDNVEVWNGHTDNPMDEFVNEKEKNTTKENFTFNLTECDFTANDAFFIE